MDRNTRILFVGYYLLMVLFLLGVIALRMMGELGVPLLVTLPMHLFLAFMSIVMFVMSCVAIFFFLAHHLHAIALVLPIYHVLSGIFFFVLQVIVVVGVALTGGGDAYALDVVGWLVEISLFLELMFAVFILYRFNTDTNKIGWLARRKEPGQK